MTIIGKAMYSPISNASDRFSGMTPPSVAAFSSSSEASHDFIFSSRVSVDDEEDEASCSTSSLVLYSGAISALFFSRNDDDVLCAAEIKWSGDEGTVKPLTTDSRAACSKTVVKRSERIMMTTCNGSEIWVLARAQKWRHGWHLVRQPQ